MHKHRCIIRSLALIVRWNGFPTKPARYQAQFNVLAKTRVLARTRGRQTVCPAPDIAREVRGSTTLTYEFRAAT